MFEQLKIRLASFIHDRDWYPHHHPKNLAAALSREIGELSEHFISNPFDNLEEIKDELGDVLNTLILLARSLHIDLSKAPEMQDFPKNEIVYLVFLGGNILEHFLWKTDDESKSFQLNPKLERDVFMLYRFLFHFATSLQLDLLECGLDKVKKAEQKYPVSKVKGSLDKYFACKNLDLH